MFNYVKESYNELVNKVTWPTFPQLQSSTIVVMVASVIFAIVVLAMDLTTAVAGADLSALRAVRVSESSFDGAP